MAFPTIFANILKKIILIIFLLLKYGRSLMFQVMKCIRRRGNPNLSFVSFFVFFFLLSSQLSFPLCHLHRRLLPDHRSRESILFARSTFCARGERRAARGVLRWILLFFFFFIYLSPSSSPPPPLGRKRKRREPERKRQTPTGEEEAHVFHAAKSPLVVES